MKFPIGGKVREPRSGMNRCKSDTDSYSLDERRCVFCTFAIITPGGDIPSGVKFLQEVYFVMDARKNVPLARRIDVRKLATLGMLTALAYVVMWISKLLPSVNVFLDFDFKHVVICIGGFIYGPTAAGMIAVVDCVIEMITISGTGPWGCLMNIIGTASFCCTACYVYKKNHTMKGAVIGLSLGVIVMTALMLLWNYLVTPIYQGMPRSAIADMLVPVFLPFNLVKGGMNAAATLLLYKPVVGALRHARLVPESETHAAPVGGKKKLGFTIVALFLLASFILLGLVLAGVI